MPVYANGRSTLRALFFWLSFAFKVSVYTITITSFSQTEPKLHTCVSFLLKCGAAASITCVFVMVAKELLFDYCIVVTKVIII